MTDIDISKIKTGDVVGVRVIRAVVPIPCVHPGSVTVADGWGGEAIFNPSAIVSHTPAPRPALKVGDRVLQGGTEREVIWIEHDAAFMRPLPNSNTVPGFFVGTVEQWERL